MNEKGNLRWDEVPFCEMCQHGPHEHRWGPDCHCDCTVDFERLEREKRMNAKDNLRWRLACAKTETRPPYVREENEGVMLPGSNTRINDALRDVWDSAFRYALDILDDVEAEKMPNPPHHGLAVSTHEALICFCGFKRSDGAEFYQHIETNKESK